MDVSSQQVLAFRLAAQGLATPAEDALDPLRGWTTQDSPPGGATAAVLARTAADAIPVGWLDAAVEQERSVVALYNARTATAVVPADEVARYATSMLPGEDDAGLRVIAGSALPEVSEAFAEPVQLGVNAIADALDGAVLSRDELHEALRRRLPAVLLPWCTGCQSHHVRRGILVMASLSGRLCLAGRAGRQPAFARTDQWVAWDPPQRTHAGAELVRRYLTAYGPSTRQHFAQWAGLGAAHARELWALVDDECSEMTIDGEAGARALTRDVPRLQDPPAASGVRLVASGDPLLLGRDRERLAPDAAVRKQVWRALGGAGVVLADGQLVALWRARRQARRLQVTAEALAGRVPRAAIAAEARRLAPHRGCTSAQVQWR
ncbi:MAG: hypothetical protein JWN65_3980 [Solirubrobacterales bacterium]|nr:hypothetical protein [Solirubrobacterales bacterium]